jgi:ankyrin repeat protein
VTRHVAYVLILIPASIAVAIAQVPAGDRAALSLAIRQGNLDRVKAIALASPGLIGSADDSGFTPLHVAATAGRVDIIEFLLQSGADIEARTSGGQTPLFQTVPLGSGAAFEFLLRKGAKLDARDNEGKSILQFALTWQRPGMVDLILARGFVIDVQGSAGQDMLDQAANAGLPTVVTTLLSLKVPVDVGLRNGTTLLHSAARGGLVEFAARLLKAGAGVDVRDQHSLTPLQLAAFYGRDEMVKLLMAHGAKPLPRDPAARFPDLSGPYLGQKEPGPEPRIFAPGIVSTEEHETNVTFTPDGREICLSRINTDQTRRSLLITRVEGERWTAPQPAPFAIGGAEFEGAYSVDGRRLFFSSDRPLQPGGPSRQDMDLWVVERAGHGWGEPRNLGSAVNGPSNEYMPSVDREGNVYFERYGLNIARWRDGAYLPSEKIAPGITNVTNLGHPFVARDGSYLIYDARSPGSAKGLLYISYRLKDDTWSEGIRVFPGQEAREYESCPTVSPDGRFLFFGRDHDIYWASAAFIEQRRPRD